jgi:hypothetical protein
MKEVITVATGRKIPTEDYLKIAPTDLQKFDQKDQVTLLLDRRPPPPPSRPTPKGPKKPKS